MDKLKKLTPPGVDPSRTLSTLKAFLIGGLCLGILIDFVYLGNALQQAKSIRDDLSGLVYRSYPIRWSELYAALTWSSMTFFIGAVVMLSLAAENYLYFYSPSKSIYTMKRIPSPLELHRRCLTLPLLGILALALVYGAISGLYLLGCRVLIPAEAFGI